MRVMRRWLLLILIALLPMRGLVGVAMATEMAQLHETPAHVGAALHDCAHEDGPSAHDESSFEVGDTVAAKPPIS